MKLQQLRYFQAVYRFENMSKAARELRMSQPPVSVAVQELEREFGTVLFLRSGKRLLPTPEGDRLYALAEQLLNHADNVQKAMKETSQNTDTIRLGLSPMIDVPFYTKVLKRSMDELPNLYISLTEVRSDELIELTRSNAVDCAAIVHKHPLPKDFYVLPLTTVEAVYCAHRQNVRAIAAGGDIRLIAQEPLALLSKDSLLPRLVLERMEAEGIATQKLNAFYTEQLSTTMLLIRENITTGFLFRSLAETLPEISCASLCPPLTLRVSLILNKGVEKYPHMRRFINFIRDAYKISE